MTTLPDTLAASLRSWLLANRPASLPAPATGNTGIWSSDRFLLRAEIAQRMSPCLLFLTGDPAWQRGMVATARVPLEVILSTPMDSFSPDDHRLIAGDLEALFWSLTTRPGPLDLIFLHDVEVRHPLTSIDAENREQVTLHRLNILATLCTTTEDPGEGS